MNRNIVFAARVSLLAIAAAALTTCSSAGRALPEAAPHPMEPLPPSEFPVGDVGWPREVLAPDGSIVTVYQPQIDSWDDHRTIDGRAAVSIRPARSEERIVGALHLTADTEANLEERLVVAHNVTIVEASFPSIDEAEAQRYLQMVRELLPQASREIALDRLVAYVERIEARPEELKISVEPPPIYVSTEPAVLVIVDGEPILSPVEEDSQLRFAVNTNWDLFRLGENGNWYLRVGDAWMVATDWRGPWRAAGRLPDDFSRLPTGDNWEAVRATIPPRPADAAALPEVYVADRPAEMIVIDGAPEMASIEGTRLHWVSNSDSGLLHDPGDGNYYFLVSGRWFRATDLDGPWTFASRDLPADFARIPPDHALGDVLYSVPGTPQAEEALILAQIPEKAVVNRAEATVDVDYAGEPEFEPIEGTDLAYAVNTAFDVIRVGDDEFYVNFEGVWFVGPTAQGPWVVADSIPAEIYAIPADSPVHNTTYCEVYDSSQTTVTFGVTAGYWGVYYGYGSVYFGLGWYWPPYYSYPPYYYYPYYYYRPYAYGAGAWYNPNTGTFGRGGAVYGPYGGFGRASAYNPSTGTYARAAGAWGGYSGAMVAEAYNPRTGTYGQTRQSYNPYGRWGSSVVTRGDDWARTFSARGSEGGIAGGRTSGGQGGFVGRSGDDLYVGRDGAVYRRDDNGWSKREDGGWSPVEGPDTGQIQDRAAAGERGAAARDRAQAAGATGERTQAARDRASGFDRSATQGQVQNGLNRDARARSQGNQRTQSINNYRSRGGAARRGGIRRRR